MQTIVIDANNFIAGIGTEDYIADAGYSPLSRGINPYYEKGVLHFQPARIDTGWLTTYNDVSAFVKSSAKDGEPFLGHFVDKDGNFGIIDRASGLASFIFADAGQHYKIGITDMAILDDVLFVTQDDDITRLTGDPATYPTRDFSYWVATKGHAALGSGRHPLQVIEDTLYIGDDEFIHTIDSAGTTVVAAMTLPLNCKITELINHPNGRDLIAFCSQGVYNKPEVRNVSAVAFIINTVTLEFSQQIILDGIVDGARTVGGIMYVTYAGTKLGYFTDSGIVWLRDLKITYPNLEAQNVPTKHKMTNMSGTLLVVEGNSLLALGDIGAGKVFNYLLKDENGGTGIQSVFYGYTNKLYYSKQNPSGVDTEKRLLYINLDEDNFIGNTYPLYTNKYSLPFNAWVRRVEVEHSPYVTGVSLQLYNVNEDGTLADMGTFGYSTSAGANKTRWDMNIKTNLAQFAIRAVKTAGSPIGIRKMIIYYELVEE